jgi:D-inositol-3-phosphate glycosyltransferase
VVAAGVGGLLHAVGDGTTGVLLGNRQPQAWAGAVARLLSSPRRLAAMGAAAARFAGAHGWDQSATRLLDVYGDLVLEAREPAPVLEQTS